jgi:hypothetical protein
MLCVVKISGKSCQWRRPCVGHIRDLSCDILASVDIRRAGGGGDGEHLYRVLGFMFITRVQD